MKWSVRVEYWSGVLEWSGVAEILITHAESVYLTFLIHGLVFIELTSGQDIDLKHLLHILSMFKEMMH